MDRKFIILVSLNDHVVWLLLHRNYTLESSVFSVVLGDIDMPSDQDSVVKFNITHRIVRNYMIVYNFYHLFAARRR